MNVAQGAPRGGGIRYYISKFNMIFVAACTFPIILDATKKRITDTFYSYEGLIKR